MRVLIFKFLLAALIGLPLAAQAHKASDAYLQLSRAGDQLNLRWDISLRDLDATLDIDKDGDQKLSWGEVKARMDDIRAYALAHLQLQQGRCVLNEAQPPAIEGRVDGTYLVLQLQSQCAAGDRLDVDYRLFKEVDPTHRGLLRVDMGSAAAPALRSLDPVGGAVAVALPHDAKTASPSPESSGDTSFLLDGIHHILIGYDHILFLICLLLLLVVGVVAIDRDGLEHASRIGGEALDAQRDEVGEAGSFVVVVGDGEDVHLDRHRGGGREVLLSERSKDRLRPDDDHLWAPDDHAGRADRVLQLVAPHQRARVSTSVRSSCESRPLIGDTSRISIDSRSRPVITR